MSEMLLVPDDLRRTAAACSLAGRDSQDIVKRVEDSMAALEGKWSGASQQVFHQNYREWREYMMGMVALLKLVANELEATADRFQMTDK